ncbi:MAG: ABC transporter permease [Microcystis aeruginosa Ma_QC_Ch_20071001_S25]|jgi:ABC-2 type transport system permease protein|uniref:Transport permease protein n=1 Tax=Microcystis aeruginosa Ma_QC_Ch_20071001_S25D TaxID=2486250 RepID=A0A552FNX6_MICAE|nr:MULTISPECIES: ABC transporter permease [unclassified Microcystis]MCA2762829.1 ABC transporter permease [Microcystis sp. M151S2]MCA2928704.1 ABC transporter permease [Microcystis sp. M020S1]MCA2933498.1 ABC transporter permease [Microcystis sp. M015S1]NCR73072.1 ABC transporter permease [Microcystis aeruginosa LG13-12]TRU48436.1 MAG: ABC transporter permease [Microcystis aeruginosa Ma_QC_Ch_20071001_S25D]TRU49175.1 MAG: ABC transporter permease [Microcystis aeruginosa Ma_QC_Ch_20071001_S25]
MSQTITPSSLKASLAPNPTRGATVDDGGNVLGEFLQETLAMTKRLFIQLQRRPSTLIAGVIQPFMWLILFGALFYNAPQGLFGNDLSYAKFLAPGVIVFTAFSGALNAGLPVMFDREFGFLNRLLVAPLTTRYSIVAASTIYIIALSFIQTASIVAASAFLGAGLPSLAGLGAIALIVFLIVLGMTALSLSLTFALPGHIELIAVIFVTNLPLLFASTALAPLNFMADWLKVIASLNPLTYAIEPIRYIYFNQHWSFDSIVLQTPWLDLNFLTVLGLLLAFDLLILLAIQPLLRRRFA